MMHVVRHTPYMFGVCCMCCLCYVCDMYRIHVICMDDVLCVVCYALYV